MGGVSSAVSKVQVRLQYCDAIHPVPRHDWTAQWDGTIQTYPVETTTPITPQERASWIWERIDDGNVSRTTGSMTWRDGEVGFAVPRGKWYLYGLEIGCVFESVLGTASRDDRP